ncbi:MAG TPA: ABC transporter permease [Gemmatimonadaceae bacterium]
MWWRSRPLFRAPLQRPSPPAPGLHPLKHTPLAVAIVSLGIALGLCTTMFSLVDAVVHPYVPYRDPEAIYAVIPKGGDRARHSPTTYEHFLALRGDARFRDVVAVTALAHATVRAGARTRDVKAVTVSPNLFRVLGVAPALGRGFASLDGLNTDETQVVIGERLWRQVRGARRTPRGMTLMVNDRAYTVVGVMPDGVDFPFGAELWMPIPAGAVATGDGLPGVAIWYRRERGVSAGQVQTELAAIAARVSAEHRLLDKPIHYRTWQPFSSPFRPAADPVHFVLGGAVAVVLLIACANLSNLLLARGVARRRELAIRAALGASRGALARLVLAECALIVAAGAVVGGVVTLWANDIVRLTVPRALLELGLIEPRTSWRAFAFALLIALGTMVVFGLLPALRAAATDPNDALKDGAGITTREGRRRYSVLVIAEGALSMVLLLGAALLVRTARGIAAFDFGYDPRALIVASNGVYGKRWLGGEGAARFYDEMLTRVSSLPEARSAALFHDARPVGHAVTFEDAGRGTDSRFLPAYRIVTPGYLRTLGIRITEGRDFEAGDAVTGAVVINHAAARLLWPFGGAVGKMIKFAPEDSARRWYRVVGVARDAFEARPEDAGAEPGPRVYVVTPDDDAPKRSLVARAAADPSALAMVMRREIATLSPVASAAMHIEPWTESLDRAAELARFLSALFGSFAIFGLAISAIGVYGVVSYTVSRRLRELAVRVALGAAARDVWRLVMHDAAVMLLAGTGIGALAALWAAWSLRFLAWGLGDAHLALPLVTAEVVLLAVGFAACVAPARRAAGVDPAETMRAC